MFHLPTPHTKSPQRCRPKPGLACAHPHARLEFPDALRSKRGRTQQHRQMSAKERKLRVARLQNEVGTKDFRGHGFSHEKGSEVFFYLSLSFLISGSDKTPQNSRQISRNSSLPKNQKIHPRMAAPSACYRSPKPQNWPKWSGVGAKGVSTVWNNGPPGVSCTIATLFCPSATLFCMVHIHQNNLCALWHLG